MADANSLTTTPAWAELQRQRTAFTDTLPALFQRDPLRHRRFTFTAADLALDISRQHLSEHVMQALLALATQEAVTAKRDALFAGDILNNTENRAVTHWRWRMAAPPADIAATQARTAALATAVRSGAWLGTTGKPIRHIVNIGIGGSDLGPRLITEALLSVDSALTPHFIGNVDATDLARVTAQINQQGATAETLFVIVSKSMTTLETRLNAEAARAWLIAQLGDAADLSRHLVAVTSNLPAAAALGIPPENCFGFEDSVGGRYSLWSPVGLTAEIVLGPDTFAQLRAGAAAMDDHFRAAPLAQSLPVLLALVSLWQVNFWNTTALAVLPYASRLAQLPNWLQQLSMESNGKGITRDGQPVDYATAPVIFGSAGTIGQHSFHQLLHQGTETIPADFIIASEAVDNADTDMQRWLKANALAQSAALLYGNPSPDAARAHPGNRPSTLIFMPRCDARSLGALLALYEHKTIVEGFLWRLNSFDQFGVELGKTMGVATHAFMQGDSDARIDPATRARLADWPL